MVDSESAADADGTNDAVHMRASLAERDSLGPALGQHHAHSGDDEFLGFGNAFDSENTYDDDDHIDGYVLDESHRNVREGQVTFPLVRYAER